MVGRGTEERSVPPIVAFTGAAGAGKTIASLWCAAWNSRCNRLLANQAQYFIAKGLLNGVEWVDFPFSRWEFLRHSVLKDFGLPAAAMRTGRELLAAADEFVDRSTVMPGYHLDLLRTEIENALRSYFNARRPEKGNLRPTNRILYAVIDDLAYEEEAELVRSYGGVVIRVIRPGFDRPARLYDGRARVGEVDFTVVNDGSLQDMFTKLHALLPPGRVRPCFDVVGDVLKLALEDFSGRKHDRHELDRTR